MPTNKNFTLALALALPVVGLFFCFTGVEAYGTGSTHPFLTKQIANLYNAIYAPELTDEQIRQMVEGSVDEDITPRWINHFYDPTTGEGLLGKRLGDLPSEDIINFIKVVFDEIPDSTMDWVHNQELQQNSYALFEGNRTFESAALSYADDNNSEAYYSLGYVLHALEDMAVPAHTRQDSHFDMKISEEIQEQLPIKLDRGESYERWAESYTRYNPADLVEELKNNYEPLCSSLDDCLKILAKYSNENFFSSDTISDEEYKLPKISYYKIEKIGEKDNFITYFSKDNIPLFKKIINTDSGKTGDESLDYTEINQAYWDKLAPKAVLAGVEVVRYFQEQAEKAKKGEITIDRVSEMIDPIADFKNFSPYGQIVLMYNEGKAFVADFWHRMTNFGRDIALRFDDMLNNIGLQAFVTSVLPGSSMQESDLASNSGDNNFRDNDQTNQDDNGNLIFGAGTGGPEPALMTEQEKQDLLDDIAEQLDIIRQQIQELMGGQNSNSLDNGQNLEPDQNTGDNNQNNQNNNQDSQTIQNNNQNAGSSGGGSQPVYPKILISEAQIAGTADSKEEFVELYNPNDSDIDLTGWYLQRKTATGTGYSTFAPNTLFSGRKIGAKGYFVIARTGYFSSPTDISVDNPITEDNSFVLKNPNGDISDKLGFGQAQDYESAPADNPGIGQSIGRKVLSDGTEQDTDNNSADFELQTPTLKAKNVTYIAPIIPPGPPPTPTDTTAPQVVFNLNPAQINLNFIIDFTITDPLTAVSPSGIDNYVFRWQEEGGSWQEDAPEKVSGVRVSADIARDFIGEDGKTYYFQVKVEDIAGNKSDWQPETPASTTIDVFKKVLINEIEVEGSADEKEEFVELYNPMSVDIDLTGWYLQRKTSTGTSYTTFAPNALFMGKKIKAKGFFLIARRDSLFANLSDITTTYSLVADNTLIIKNAKGDIIDKVGWGQAQDYESAPAPNPDKGQSIQRIWDNVISAYQDTDDNSVDFEKLIPTPKASGPKAYIWDGTGDVAEGMPPDYSGCGGSSMPGTLYCFLKIKWQSPSLIASYQVQYKLNNNDWQDWLADTVETEGIFKTIYSLFNDNIYLFRVRAEDAEGNVGDWAELEQEINLANPVSINEVALFSANSSRDDQWVELYNKSAADVDLTGWKLVSDSGIIELNGTIPAKGYFMLERNDTIFTASLGTNSLKLIDKNSRYADQIYAPWGGWPADKFLIEDNYYTLERISAYSFGMDPENWRISPGTPGSQNSVYQIYTSYYMSFEEDVILRKELSPYLFWGPSIYVFKENTLTIEPGTVIKFLSGGLAVNGALKAIGAPDQTIIFTSFTDDEYAGDTNGDADKTQPNPGDWYGISFGKDSPGSELENVVIRYAGEYRDTAFGAAIRVDRSIISLKNSVIEKNKYNGLRFIDSPSVVDSAQFFENKNAEWPNETKAVLIEGGRPEIRNCYFKDNKYGIFITGWYDTEGDIRAPAIPVIENNVFEENSTPIRLGSYSHPSLVNNSGANNDIDAIALSGHVEDDTTLSPDILPYFINTGLSVLQGRTLTIEPGTIVKFSNSGGLIVGGALKAKGAPDAPIIFTSYNGVSPGDWFGLYFTKDSLDSELENVEISYAGDYNDTAFGAAIRVDQSIISLKNSVVRDNANNGLWLVNSDSVIDSAQFLNHIEPDLPSAPKAVYIQGGRPEIKNSHFQTNYYAIYMNQWYDPDTGLGIYPMPNLHTTDPDDPEKNTFMDTTGPRGDIWDASAP